MLDSGYDPAPFYVANSAEQKSAVMILPASFCKNQSSSQIKDEVVAAQLYVLKEKVKDLFLVSNILPVVIHCPLQKT